MNTYTLLKDLMCCPSVSGRETKIMEKIRGYIAPLTDTCRTDALGNLIALKKGNGQEETKKKLMLCAHMDEIGFIVTFVENNGYIRVAPVGGIHFVAAAYAPVVSENGVCGVLAPDAGTPVTELGAEKVFVDIGARNKKEAERKVKIGDFFVLEPYAKKLCGTRVCGRPFDDRVGCAVLIRIAEQLKDCELENDVYLVFSVQEEVGCRGSKPAAFSVMPDVALAVDVTGTGDIPGAKPMACAVGDGAAIKLKDNSVICDGETVARLTKLAKENQIRHQHEILRAGGTDAGSMQMAGNGCRAAALSIPSRYIHSGAEVIDLADAEACVALAVAFAKTL